MKREELRNSIRATLTHNAGRIPERLEADIDDIMAAIDQYHKQGKLEELKDLRKSFDKHAESIGLWGMKGLALDSLAREGKLDAAQREERNAMVTERRALAILHGTTKDRIAELEADVNTHEEGR